MPDQRLLGVKLIAVYYGLKSVALICAAAIGCLEPGFRPTANEFISHFVPLLKQLHILSFGILLAPVFAVFEAILAMGTWFLKRWARTYILVTISCWFCQVGIAVAILWAIERNFLISTIKSPYFAFGIVTSIVMFNYLLDPDTKRAFGVPDESS